MHESHFIGYLFRSFFSLFAKKRIHHRCCRHIVGSSSSIGNHCHCFEWLAKFPCWAQKEKEKEKQ